MEEQTQDNQIVETTTTTTAVSTDEKKNDVQNWWPYLLIVIGGYLLLNNFNVFNTPIWRVLWKLWPLILIYIGIDRLTQYKPRTRMVAMLVLIVLTVFLMLMLSRQ